MSDREISPLPDSSQPQGAGHYRAEDDIELPPHPGAESGDTAAANWSVDEGSSKSNTSKGFSSYLVAAALVAAIAVGGLFAVRGGSAEKTHPNWQHVAAAADASDAGVAQLVHLDAAGAFQPVPTVELASADRDRGATRQIRAALRRDDLVSATAHLQAAQGLPSASQNPDVAPPHLAADSELTKAIQDGQELFQVELFDCCDEDGDIVEVLVNGSPFATVPIRHGGTKLSLPLARGNNSVTIRGVKDGGGGITLSFRTSRGDYFARSMRVGEAYPIGVVVR